MRFRAAASGVVLGLGLGAGCATPPPTRAVADQPRDWSLPERRRITAPDEDPNELRAAEVAERVSVHTTGVAALSTEDIVKAALDEFHEIVGAGATTDVPLLAEDVEFRVEDEYHRRGYPDADVTVAVGGLRDKGSRRVDVVAREGPRTIVADITVEGARHVAPDELARYYRDYAPRTVPIIGGHLYVERVAEAAAQRMRERYQAEGYRDARARLDRVEWSVDRRAVRLRYVVGEGRRARLADLTIDGRDVNRPDTTIQLDIPPAELRAELRTAGIHPGVPYSPLLGSRARDTLLRYYAEQGYPFAVIQISEGVTIDRDGVAQVTLALDVIERQFTRVCRIGVAGNSWTQDRVIMREVEHLRGTVYQASQVDEAHRALSRLGIFRSVHVHRQAVYEVLTEPDGTPRTGPGGAPLTKLHPDLVDLLVEVDETDAAVLRADIGWATNEGPRVAPTIDLPNLTGWGHSMQVRGLLSELRRRIEGKFTAPWAAGLPVRARLRGGLDDRPVPLSRNHSFRVREAEFEATLSKALLGPLEGLFGYRFTASSLYDVQPGAATSGGTNPIDNLRASSLFLGWILDGRDNRWNPREGAFASMTITHSGHFNLDGTWEKVFGDAWTGSLGGNMHLGRLEGEIAAYASAGRFTLAFRGAAEAVAYRPTAAQRNQGSFGKLPPPYRVFSGGHRSVRSFREGELGPMSGDNPASPGNEGGAPLGGLGSGVINAELRMRIWPDVNESPFGIGAVLFADAGAVWPYEDEALSMVRFTEGLAASAAVPSDVRDRYRTRPTDLAFALGFGIRIETIIGPIGFEVGWNPDRRRIPPVRANGRPRHEDAFAFFFQVGQTF